MSRRFASTRPSFGDSKSGSRVSIDSLVQASLVDLFNAYGVAFAPLPRSSVSASMSLEVSAAAAFRSAGGPSGRLTLSLPAALLEHMRSAEATSVRMDWARELANQLLGRVKNRLLPFGVRLQVGLLTLLDSKQLQHQLQDPSAPRMYVGRTLHGLVLVTAQGLPEDSTLAYVGAAGVSEGSLLWL